ncbi:MAG: hypothetical protein AB8G11_08330 [Saprospiraceae bacterium]
MKKKFESIKDLKFQALEKTQMMKILGGDCATGGGTNTMSDGTSYKYSSDTTDSDVMPADKAQTKHYYGANDAASVEGYENCGEC